MVTTGTIEPGPTLQYPFGAIFLSEQKVIVVIDDDVDILHSLELMLSLCGYHTKLFASAEEFLSAAATLEAACLIVDLHLGEISGLELVRALYAQGCEVPVIFITGSRDELHRRQAIELGCAAFLLKPFSAERLIDTVKKAIGSKLN
jgi:FixJ family two-component response regulator